MLVCNTCERSDDEVKIAKKDGICKKCKDKIWKENNKDKTLKEIYYNLFSLYILEINPKWIEIRLLDIEKDFETNTIDVYYVCSIPIESRLKNAYFINNNQTLVSHIIQKASRYS